MANVRNVVSEPSFDKTREKVEPNLKRFDEAFAATEWMLARFPEAGRRTSPDSLVWYIQVENDPGLRPAFVYYTFTDTHVHLLFVELVSESNGERY